MMCGMRFWPLRAASSTWIQGIAPALSIAASSQRAGALDLLSLQRFVDALERDGRFDVEAELVDADDDLLLGFDRLLEFVRGVLDFLLHVSALDCLQHAAHGLDLVEVVPGALFDLVGERLP